MTRFDAPYFPHGGCLVHVPIFSDWPDEIRWLVEQLKSRIEHNAQGEPLEWADAMAAAVVSQAEAVLMSPNRPRAAFEYAQTIATLRIMLRCPPADLG